MTVSPKTPEIVTFRYLFTILSDPHESVLFRPVSSCFLLFLLRHLVPPPPEEDIKGIRKSVIFCNIL
jgi:hypothetical protein